MKHSIFYVFIVTSCIFSTLCIAEDDLLHPLGIELGGVTGDELMNKLGQVEPSENSYRKNYCYIDKYGYIVNYEGQVSDPEQLILSYFYTKVGALSFKGCKSTNKLFIQPTNIALYEEVKKVTQYLLETGYDKYTNNAFLITDKWLLDEFDGEKFIYFVKHIKTSLNKIPSYYRKYIKNGDEMTEIIVIGISVKNTKVKGVRVYRRFEW